MSLIGSSSRRSFVFPAVCMSVCASESFHTLNDVRAYRVYVFRCQWQSVLRVYSWKAVSDTSVMIENRGITEDPLFPQVERKKKSNAVEHGWRKSLPPLLCD